MEQQIQLMTAKQVCKMTGLSIATLYRLVGAGRFPRGLKIGRQAVRWRADEIAAHIQKLSEARPVSTPCEPNQEAA